MLLLEKKNNAQANTIKTKTKTPYSVTFDESHNLFIRNYDEQSDASNEVASYKNINVWSCEKTADWNKLKNITYTIYLTSQQKYVLKRNHKIKLNKKNNIPSNTNKTEMTSCSVAFDESHNLFIRDYDEQSDASNEVASYKNINVWSRQSTADWNKLKNITYTIYLTSQQKYDLKRNHKKKLNKKNNIPSNTNKTKMTPYPVTFDESHNLFIRDYDEQSDASNEVASNEVASYKNINAWSRQSTADWNKLKNITYTIYLTSQQKADLKKNHKIKLNKKNNIPSNTNKTEMAPYSVTFDESHNLFIRNYDEQNDASNEVVSYKNINVWSCKKTADWNKLKNITYTIYLTSQQKYDLKRNHKKKLNKKNNIPSNTNKTEMTCYSVSFDHNHKILIRDYDEQSDASNEVASYKNINVWSCQSKADWNKLKNITYTIYATSQQKADLNRNHKKKLNKKNNSPSNTNKTEMAYYSVAFDESHNLFIRDYDEQSDASNEVASYKNISAWSCQKTADWNKLKNITYTIYLTFQQKRDLKENHKRKLNLRRNNDNSITMLKKNDKVEIEQELPSILEKFTYQAIPMCQQKQANKNFQNPGLKNPVVIKRESFDSFIRNNRPSNNNTHVYEFCHPLSPEELCQITHIIRGKQRDDNNTCAAAATQLANTLRQSKIDLNSIRPYQDKNTCDVSTTKFLTYYTYTEENAKSNEKAEPSRVNITGIHSDATDGYTSIVQPKQTVFLNGNCTFDDYFDLTEKEFKRTMIKPHEIPEFDKKITNLANKKNCVLIFSIGMAHHATIKKNGQFKINAHEIIAYVDPVGIITYIDASQIKNGQGNPLTFSLTDALKQAGYEQAPIVTFYRTNEILLNPCYYNSTLKKPIGMVKNEPSCVSNIRTNNANRGNGSTTCRIYEQQLPPICDKNQNNATTIKNRKRKRHRMASHLNPLPSAKKRRPNANDHNKIRNKDPMPNISSQSTRILLNNLSNPQYERLNNNISINHGNTSNQYSYMPFIPSINSANVGGSSHPGINPSSASNPHYSPLTRNPATIFVQNNHKRYVNNRQSRNDLWKFTT